MEEPILALVELPEKKPKKIGWFFILMITVIIFDLFAYCSSWGEDPNFRVSVQVSSDIGTVNLGASL